MFVVPDRFWSSNKSFPKLWQKQLSGCHNRIWRVQVKIFSKIFFLIIKFFFSIWWILWKESGLLKKRSQQGCQKWILRFQRVFYGFLFEKTTLHFLTFGTWAKNYPTFSGKLSGGSSSLHLTSPEELFLQLLLKNTNRFITSGLYPQKSIQFWCRDFSQFFKKGIWVSTGTFCKKKHFFNGRIYMIFLIVCDFGQKTFQTLAKIFQQACHNRIWRVKVKNLSNFF